MTTWTPDALRAFEQRVADKFNAGEIRAPVHLAGGNEEQLIDYFAREYSAERGDWVCGAWRTHYHCLLAGVDPERLMSDIVAGRSITLTYPDHRIVTSAIVGGVLPIALGLALAEKMKWRQRRSSGLVEAPVARVHAFVGDMTQRTGAYHEANEYAWGHDLPLNFVLEDNGKSVGTPTAEVWGDACSNYTDLGARWFRHKHSNHWPHSGAGRWVNF